MKNIFGLALAIGVGIFNSCARAAEIDIGPVYIDMVAIIQVASGGHLAGNMEVKVRGGFSVPAGPLCTSPYITTLKAIDADQRMFKLLTVAQLTGKPVRLRISDDPSLQAFGGRCSLVWVAFDA